MKIAVIDTETTGVDPDVDAVCEVAYVPVLRDDVAWMTGIPISTLVNPGRRIPPEARAVHHISDEDVRGAPGLRQALDMTVPADYDYYAAHNAAFDRGFVEPYLQCAAPWICTWRCAMHLWPDAPKHTNQVLRYWLGLDVDTGGLSPHRAASDAMVTAAILRRMLETLDVAALLDLTDAPVLLSVVRFGKHRGQRWEHLPTDYLSWILRQSGTSTFDRDTRHTAKSVLESRCK